MKIRKSVWLVLLGLVALLTLFIVAPTGWWRQRGADAGPSLEQRQDEGTAQPALAEDSPLSGVAEPAKGGTNANRNVAVTPANQAPPLAAMPPPIDPAPGTNPAPPQTQIAPPTQPAPASNPEPEANAEVRSYSPIMQQNAATNFIRALEKLSNARTEVDRYLVLDTAAKLAFVFGKTEEARSYANESLALDEKFQGQPWRGGDATHNSNLVLGRIAAQEGQTEEANRYLLEAGRSTGSPLLGSFGPNMSLARDLLQKGQPDTVLEYFDLCSKFWASGNDKLSLWAEDVKAGRLPDFGANLHY